MLFNLLVISLASAAATAPKNVLYLIVDDLRAEMKVAYRQDHMHTPTFDRLANESLVFGRAYCQIAVCAPSRSSFMSGIRPDGSAIFNFANTIRDPGLPKITTLPQQFKKFNYTVLGGGKTFHYDHPPYFDDTGPHGSWSSEVQPYYPFLEYGGSIDSTPCPLPEGYVENPAKLDPQACALDVPMESFYDYRLANHTIKSLRRAKDIGKPFFVMAGFRRPHRVFRVHKRFWDLYPEPAEIAVAKVQVRDSSQPELAFHHGDFTLPNGSYYPGNADKPWPLFVQQTARKGYYAAVSQVPLLPSPPCSYAVLFELHRLIPPLTP
jgi:arylsulfatase A-like enzyme